jgi:hypothetical protein
MIQESGISILNSADGGSDFVKPLLNTLVEGPKVDETSSPLSIRSFHKRRLDKPVSYEILEVAFRKSAILCRIFECGPSWLYLLAHCIVFSIVRFMCRFRNQDSGTSQGYHALTTWRSNSSHRCSRHGKQSLRILVCILPAWPERMG